VTRNSDNLQIAAPQLYLLPMLGVILLEFQYGLVILRKLECLFAEEAVMTF